MKNYANPNIQRMKPYYPPLENRRNFKGLLLDFNERTIPVSENVTKALYRLIRSKKFQVYPEYFDLCKQIAKYAGTSPEEIMITNGGNQGIDIVFRTFTQKQSVVIIPSPSFAMFYQCAGIQENKIITPLYGSGGSFPLKEVLMSITDRTKLVIVCNPNNPTGTVVQPRVVEKILKKALRTNTMVMVDEAYSDFSGVTMESYINKYPNLVIVRTFSKAFGLPSMRIGYVISSRQNIDEMMKVRGPYDINMAAYCSAEAAIKDIKNMKRYVKEVMTKAKPMVENFFRENGIYFYPSGANFILFRPNTNSKQTVKYLEKNGILTRSRKGFSASETVRVTIGTPEQMKTFINKYKELLKPQKYAFLDRDGTLIYEPQTDFQIDSIKKLKILPGAIKGLKKLIKRNYKLILVSNQDGLGTKSFPAKNFEVPQNRMLQIFSKNGIEFERIFICPHFKKDKCKCRKPKTGLVKDFLKESDIDFKSSFVYGDRATDGEFAKNIGVRFIKAKTNGNWPSDLLDNLQS